MTRFGNLVDTIREDVNNDNGYTIAAFGRITNFLFKVIFWLGIPYLAYLFIQFSHLI